MRVVGVGLALALTACAGAPPPSPSPPPVRPRAPSPRLTLGHAEVVLEPDGGEPVTVQVEVAATVALQRRGLMFRRSMPRDAGMLFVFEEPEVQSFWMRNTYLRLDMIFIGEDHRVAGIVENAQPLTEAPRAIDAESKYVLEVHGGYAAAHGIVPGTRVRFVGLSEE
ncbi:MAG: DUF192 domain-containing protein [Sandaracinaceae bacterium]|nr:DUF192 domain-containing protein [Sandaracinaceae bacterium]